MWRGELRFASVRDGGPSAVMSGLKENLMLSVNEPTGKLE